MKSLLCAGSCSILFAAGAAAAAQPPAPPTREELTPDIASPAPARLGASVEFDEGIQRAPCPLNQPQFADVRFTLRGVRYENLDAVSPEVLAPAAEGMIGRDIPIAALCEIRDRAATILRNQGFLAAVQVPPQEIGPDGIVRFDVLEARIARLQVRGETGNGERVLESYLAPLAEQPVFNQYQAERNLMLLSEIPGFNGRLTLRSAEGAPGQIVGDVIIQRDRFAFEVQGQNYGARSAGRDGVQARVQVNDLTGMGDRTSLSVYGAGEFEEQRVVSLAHDFAAGGDGGRMGASYAYAISEPDFGGISPFETTTELIGLYGSYPVILNQSARLGVSAGLDVVNQDIEFAGVILNSDRLRVGYVRVDGAISDRPSLSGRGGYNPVEPQWRMAVSAELRQGISLFSASEPGLGSATPQSRIAAETDATVFRVEALAEYRPMPRLALVFQPRFQVASAPLLPFEELSGGNFTIGRGYDPGSITGDEGVGFRAEARYGTLGPMSRQDLAFQPYVFVDALWVNNHDPAGLGNAGSDHLASAGAGVRGNYGDRIRFDLGVGAPMVRTQFNGLKPDPRVLVSVTFRHAQ